jgi:hypothetical protein
VAEVEAGHGVNGPSGSAAEMIDAALKRPQHALAQQGRHVEPAALAGGERQVEPPAAQRLDRRDPWHGSRVAGMDRPVEFVHSRSVPSLASQWSGSMRGNGLPQTELFHAS